MTQWNPVLATRFLRPNYANDDVGWAKAQSAAPTLYGAEA
jgi:hypothetical protein